MKPEHEEIGELIKGNHHSETPCSQFELRGCLWNWKKDFPIQEMLKNDEKKWKGYNPFEVCF